MPSHVKSFLFLLLGTAALIACVAPTEKSWAETPAEKKAKQADKKAKDAEKKALEHQTKQLLEIQRKVMEAQKKAWELRMKAMAKQAIEVRKKQQAGLLMSAYMLLNAANSNYDGHKEKAMNHVQSALVIVDSGGLKQSAPRIKANRDLNTLAMARLAASGKGKTFEAQILSDSQLAHALGMLQGLASPLNATKEMGPLGHVENAVREITAALKTSALDSMKGREADVLTFAYILLASANHDYRGHQPIAMVQVRLACKILEVDLFNNGPIDKKIKALRDDYAAAMATNYGNVVPPVHESRYYSDAQLLMADALIQRVGYFLIANNTQPQILRHLGTADREIGLALMQR
jgi:hypothetical protein